MKSVGIRELKNQLSKYVRDVRSGEVVQVTDRGEVVAELVPPGHPHVRRDVPPVLLELAKRGEVTLGVGNNSIGYPTLTPLLTQEEIMALLDEERGER